MRTAGVYKISNHANGKIYIGSSCDMRRRLRQHLLELRRGAHENPFLQNSFARHGEENFHFEVALICGKENILMYEQLLINGLNCTDRSIGYNLCPIAGNTAGRIVSEETKRRMSEARKGMKLSEEHRRNIGLAGIGSKHNLGKVHSEEHKRKASEKMKQVRKERFWSSGKKRQTEIFTVT